MPQSWEGESYQGRGVDNEGETSTDEAMRTSAKEDKVYVAGYSPLGSPEDRVRPTNGLGKGRRCNIDVGLEDNNLCNCTHVGTYSKDHRYNDNCNGSGGAKKIATPIHEGSDSRPC